MNKKLLLLALPALMVLSGCSGVKSSPKANLMAEDNLAHEEIFGAAIEAGELGMKKQAPRRLASLSTWDGGFVKVGYQINYKAADDTLSIRFVAAIKDAGVTAYWHRGMAQPNGYEGANVSGSTWKFKFSEYNADDEGMESTKIYSTLSDGTNTITAGSGDFAGYSGFAIYTVTGIPYETYKDSYFAAYVILAEDGAPSNMIKSKAQAIKIEKSGTSSVNRFFFDPTITGHFLEGTINGVVRDGSDNSTHSLYAATEATGNFYANYTDVALSAGDSFGSFYYDQDDFQFFGYSSFFDGAVDHFNASASMGGYASPKSAGTYTLNVASGAFGKSVENHISSIGSSGDSQTFTVLGLPSWISNADAVVFASVQFANDSWNWISVDYAGSVGTFTAPNNSKNFLLVRCHKDTVTPNWGETNNVAGKIYNQTSPDTPIVNGQLVYAPTWPE